MVSNSSSSQGDYETLKIKGNEKFKAKNYDQAIEYYTKAIESKDDEPIAYSNRSLCFINLKRYFEAKDDCDKAIELDPNMDKAYYRRAIALKELSRYDKAMEDFKRVLSLDPNFTLAQEEIDKIQSLMMADARLDLKVFEKPEKYRSKTDIKLLELKNQYRGAKSYSQL